MNQKVHVSLYVKHHFTCVKFHLCCYITCVINSCDIGTFRYVKCKKSHVKMLYVRTHENDFTDIRCESYFRCDKFTYVIQTC